MKPIKLETPGRENEINLDCPDSIVHLITKPCDLKCEKCELIPNFSFYNYKDIILNLVCNKGHINNLNLDNYIRKIKNIYNLNIKETFCTNCNEKDKINYCQFCNRYLCQNCNLNHFTIEHIFKNNILKDFSNEIKIEDEEIKEKFNKSINYLKEIEEYFKEIENNFKNYMIDNLDELLLIKILLDNYLILKKENSENSKKLLENIKYLSSFKDIKINKNEFNEFLKNKENYILKGNEYKGDLNNGKVEMNYFIGKYEGEFKNGIREGKGKFIYNNNNIYDGEWKNDIKEGKGIMNYKNGEKFYFSNDKFEEIEKFDGYWKNNKKMVKVKFILKMEIN